MIRIILAALALCAAAPVFADDPPADPPSAADAGPADAAAAPAPTSAEPTTADIIQGAGEVMKAAANWKSVGLLGLCAALLALLTQVSKLGLLKRLLDDKGLGHLRPLIPLVLAGLTGCLGSLQNGVPPGPAIVAGLLAGLAGVGLHETSRLASKADRARVRVDGGAVDAAASSLKKTIEDAMASAQQADNVIDKAHHEKIKKLAALEKLPAHKRLEELAKMLA